MNAMRLFNQLVTSGHTETLLVSEIGKDGVKQTLSGVEKIAKAAGLPIQTFRAPVEGNPHMVYNSQVYQPVELFLNQQPDDSYIPVAAEDPAPYSLAYYLAPRGH